MGTGTAGIAACGVNDSRFRLASGAAVYRHSRVLVAVATSGALVRHFSDNRRVSVETGWGVVPVGRCSCFIFCWSASNSLPGGTGGMSGRWTLLLSAVARRCFASVGFLRRRVGQRQVRRRGRWRCRAKILYRSGEPAFAYGFYFTVAWRVSRRYWRCWSAVDAGRRRRGGVPAPRQSPAIPSGPMVFTA